MEQLWYTWSINGPKSGFQIRATSPGLREDGRAGKLLPFVAYSLPEGTVTYDIDPRSAPITLSFTDTRMHGHILIRKVYAGLDGAHRPGAFFSHLVLLNDLSKPFTMREAIDLWASGFWREKENANDPRILPLVTPGDLTARLVNPFEQFDSSKRPALEALFATVLHAFLTYENSRRFYILAPSPVVTAIVWGLAHCLPRTLSWWHKITFTTYDDDVSKASEFIVGTFRYPTSSSQDLPETCYGENNIAIAINPETFQIRRRFLSQLSQEPLYVKYVSYATKCLVGCSMKELLDLVDMAEQQAIDTIPEFLKLYEQEITGKLLSPEELLVALRNKTANEAQLKKPKNQKVFVAAIINIPGYWEGSARAALAAFCRRAESDPEADDIRVSLTQEVGGVLTTAAQSNNSTALLYLLQAMVELAPAKRNASIWQRLLPYLSRAVVPFAPVVTNLLIPWDTRELLLSQWTQIVQPDKEAEIHAWLKAAWGDLGQLLRLVPQEWHKLVMSFRLAENKPIPPEAIINVANVVQQYSNSLFMPVLLEFVRGSKEQVEAAVNFINQSLEYKYATRLQFLFEALLADRDGLTTQLLNTKAIHFLQREDLFHFVESCIPQLIERKSVTSAAELIKHSMNRYFDSHQPSDLVSRLLNITNLITNLIPHLNGGTQRRMNQADDILDALTRKVVDALLRIVQMQDSDAFYRLLTMLQQLAPDGKTSASINAWQELLKNLPIPKHDFPWLPRELLLVQCAKVVYTPNTYIPYWLDVQWSELERLLALPIPEEWRLLAIEKRIEDDAPLPPGAKAFIEKDRRIDQTLQLYITNRIPAQIEVTVRFVKKLLTQKSPRRLSLLLLVLQADKAGDATLHLGQVNLKDDLFEFVENHLQALFDYAKRKYTGDILLRYIDLYFAELAPADLISHQATRDLLHNLRRILALDLKTDQLRARILCWQEIASFLEPRQDKGIASCHEIGVFAKTLASGALPSKTLQQLSLTLAPVLASHNFENQPLELVRIVNLMEEALLDSTSLCLLEGMTVRAGREFGDSQRKIFPYIMLVLDEAHRLADTEKKLFLENSLNHLLIHIGSREERLFQEIERRVEDLPEGDIAEWKAYLDESRFAQIQAATFSTMRWRSYFQISYWRKWRVYRNLRKAIRGRIATEIARVAHSLPENDRHLTDDENDIVLSAKDFSDAYNENKDIEIVHTYQSIWENYRGRLFFNSQELGRIEEAEQKLLARGRADT